MGSWVGGAEEWQWAAIPFTRVVILAHSGHCCGWNVPFLYLGGLSLLGKVNSQLRLMWTIKQIFCLSSVEAKAKYIPQKKKGMGFLQVTNSVLCGGWKKRLINVAHASGDSVAWWRVSFAQREKTWIWVNPSLWLPSWVTLANHWIFQNWRLFIFKRGIILHLSVLGSGEKCRRKHFYWCQAHDGTWWIFSESQFYT